MNITFLITPFGASTFLVVPERILIATWLFLTFFTLTFVGKFEARVACFSTNFWFADAFTFFFIPNESSIAFWFYASLAFMGVSIEELMLFAIS
jgi:hypothetical protein